MGLSCKYCKSRNIQKLYILSHHLIYRCKRCLLIQTEINYKKIYEININKYNDKYLDEYEQKRREKLIKFYSKCLEDIEKLKKGYRILDIGCGPGLFLETVLNFSKNNWQVYGIDINKKSLRRVNINIKKHTYRCSIEHNQLDTRSFDVITCFDSMEHFLHLRKSLDQIIRIIKEDGLFVVQVPNYDSTMREICRSDWDWWCVPDHIYHFQLSVLRNILLDYGFRIVSIKTWEPFDIFVKNAQGHIKNVFPKIAQYNKFVAKIAFIPLTVVWLFQKLIDRKKGGLIYIIAQKQ